MLAFQKEQFQEDKRRFMELKKRLDEQSKATFDNLLDTSVTSDFKRSRLGATPKASPFTVRKAFTPSTKGNQQTPNHSTNFPPVSPIVCDGDTSTKSAKADMSASFTAGRHSSLSLRFQWMVSVRIVPQDSVVYVFVRCD